MFRPCSLFFVFLLSSTAHASSCLGVGCGSGFMSTLRRRRPVRAPEIVAPHLCTFLDDKCLDEFKHLTKDVDRIAKVEVEKRIQEAKEERRIMEEEAAEERKRMQEERRSREQASLPFVLFGEEEDIVQHRTTPVLQSTTFFTSNGDPRTAGLF